jgi:hypothetical protein
MPVLPMMRPSRIGGRTATTSKRDEMIQTRFFIDGEYVDAKSGKSFADVEPATEREIATVADASGDDVASAVAAESDG